MKGRVREDSGEQLRRASCAWNVQEIVGYAHLRVTVALVRGAERAEPPRSGNTKAHDPHVDGIKGRDAVAQRGEPCGLAIEIEVEIVCEEVVGACDAARLPVSEMVVSQSDALV